MLYLGRLIVLPCLVRLASRDRQTLTLACSQTGSLVPISRNQPSIEQAGKKNRRHKQKIVENIFHDPHASLLLISPPSTNLA